jgi:hypothetical protein
MNFTIDGVFTDKKYQVTMIDRSVWEVPVLIIALNRANYYAKLDEVTLQEALDETVELFETDDYEIEDWARGNMNWEDVWSAAKCVKQPSFSDYADGWINGEAHIV